jgi:hypothetical protein
MPLKFYKAIKMNKLPNPSPQGKAISGDQRHTLLLIAHFLIFIPFAVYFSTDFHMQNPKEFHFSYGLY